MGLPSHQVHQIPPKATAVYVRHRPETTLLYQIVQEYWPKFQAELASHGKYLPAYITKEFDEYLKCGRLENGFFRVRCETCQDERLLAFSWPLLRIHAPAALVRPCTSPRRGFCASCGARRMADSAALLVDEILPHQPMRQWVLSVPFPLRFLLASQPAVMGKVLGIVYRAISTHLTHKAGFTKTTAQTGAVTLIQRFGGALNAHIHFHMLFLDGVYIDSPHGSRVRFRWVKAPTSEELTQLTHTIAHRVARYLERQGLLVRDTGNSYLTADGVDTDPESPLSHLLGSSINYRIAIGPQQGRKVFTLQTLPDCSADNPLAHTVGKAAGFSLHAGVATRAHERDKLERLCRYIARPAVSTQRLALTRHGKVRYQLKTPYDDGTTHVVFEPLDFMYRKYGMPRAQGCARAAISRLVALVPKPRVHLTRYHGVFAPHSKYRARVTPTKQGNRKKIQSPDVSDQTPAEKRASRTWAKRLKRVFDIDKVN